MQPKNWRGKATHKRPRASTGTSGIYRCVTPTHQYGTRPFLRWARSQGRSPHASGKAPSAFPILGFLRRQDINPPKGDISLGDGPLGPEEISSTEAHPVEPPRGKTAYRMQPKNWRGKATHKRPRASWLSSLQGIQSSRLRLIFFFVD